MVTRLTLALTLSAALVAPALVQAQAPNVAEPAAPQVVRKGPVKVFCYPAGPKDQQLWLRNISLGVVPAGTSVTWRFRNYARFPFAGTYVFTEPLRVNGSLLVPGVELKQKSGVHDAPLEDETAFALGLLDMCEIVSIKPG